MRHRCDQVGDVDLGAELCQLDRAHVGDNDADEKADQGDDRQGLGADILYHQHQVGATDLCPATEQPAERECDLAEKVQHLGCGAPHGLCKQADPLQRLHLRFPFLRILSGGN
jgi:hypothetical protein